MQWLYSVLLAGSLAVPLALSFDRSLQFRKQWRFVFPAIAIVALFYILFDVLFTRLGIWGFNPLYHFNLNLLGLPIEEWLFFVVIPFACVFLHEALMFCYPLIRVGQTITRVITVALITISLIFVIFNKDRTYTLYSFCLLAVSLFWSIFDRRETIRSFYFTFPVMLFPFVVVNGFLTGSFARMEVVWYNSREILEVRFLTIPVEDFGYSFSLVLFNLLFGGLFKQYSTSTSKSSVL